MEEFCKRPSIRFSGFTDDWEQRKLIDALSLFGGNAFSSRDSVDEGVRWLKIANVGIGEVKWDDESFLPLSYLDDYSSYQLKVGDYVMALTRPIINHELKVAKITENNILLNQRVAKLIFTGNAKFGYQLLRKRSTVKMIDNEITGTDPPNLNTNTFSHIHVSIPNLLEQEIIGNFFETLDKTITLHQRKLKEIELLKKTLLNKLFPNNGKKIPDYRFTGFNEDWEQRKFGDNFKLSQGLQVSIDDQYSEQLTNYEQFIRIIDVTQESEPPRYVFNPTGKGRVKKDDLFFVRYGAVGTIGHGYNGVIANNLFKVEPLFKAHNMFLFQQFSGTYFNEKLKEMSASTSMPAINFGALNNLMFQSTSYKEQVKIGIYFYRLDHLITLHQRKLEQLELLKNYLLKNMFV